MLIRFTVIGTDFPIHKEGHMRHIKLANFILGAFIACAISNAMALSSYAIDKSSIKEDKSCTWTFDEDENTWVCENAEGDPVTEWAKKGSKIYYLDDNGVAQTGWVKYENDWYYFYEEDEDSKKSPQSYVGSMASDTWIDNYYVGKDGVKSGKSRDFFK